MGEHADRSARYEQSAEHRVRVKLSDRGSVKDTKKDRTQPLDHFENT
ncbi:hypothetical protein N7504_004452 [Penicillium tannophilum]|nr:hypothetical protein N7504_004452 [Penicillium tannophilum]